MADFMDFKEARVKPKVEQVPDTVVKVAEDEELFLDDRMKQLVADGPQKITVPQYKRVMRGKVQVSYAVIDQEDYYYQIELNSPTTLSQKDLLLMMISTLDAVIPRHVQTYVREPTEEIPIITVIAKGAATLTGAKAYMEDKLVEKLLSIDYWPGNGASSRARSQGT